MKGVSSPVFSGNPFAAYALGFAVEEVEFLVIVARCIERFVRV